MAQLKVSQLVCNLERRKVYLMDRLKKLHVVLLRGHLKRVLKLAQSTALHLEKWMELRLSDD